MDHILKHFGLEMVEVRSIGEHWYFKRFKDGWFFRDNRTPELGWISFPIGDTDMELIITNKLSISIPSIVNRVTQPEMLDHYGALGNDESINMLHPQQLMKMIHVKKFYKIGVSNEG